MDRNAMFASIFNTLVTAAGPNAASSPMAEAFARLAKEIVKDHFIEVEKDKE